MGAEIQFPFPNEWIAATALLLLQQSPSSSLTCSSTTLSLRELNEISSSSHCSSQENSSCLSDSAAQSSSTGVQIHADPLRMLALAAASVNGIKPKVAKKARSKTENNIDKKMKLLSDFLSLDGNEEDDDKEASSLSNNTAASYISQVRSYHLRVTKTRGTRKKASGCKGWLRSGLNKWRSERSWRWKESWRTTNYKPSKRVRRQAEAIVELLSGTGWAPEVTIRAALGDSPDTSKALRMLLKQKEVKRLGAGGCTDPFLYMVAGLNSDLSTT